MAPRILLLDDDDDLRALAQAALAPLGAECVAARTPAEALEPADLLVVGSLAQGGGLDLVEQLRAAGQSARVVLLAPLTWDEATARRVDRLNIRQVLTPPFSAPELHLAVWISLHLDDTAPPPARDRTDETGLLRMAVIRALPDRIAAMEVALDAAFRGESGAKERARYLAEKLGSVAGAFGLEPLSEAAGCLERLLSRPNRLDEAQRDEARLLLGRARAGCRVNRGPVPPGASDNARLSVLLVDDQPGFLDGMQSIGPRHRVELLRADSREEAVNLAGRRRVDLAFVSRDISGSDGGVEVLTALRSQPGLENLPLVLYGRDSSFGQCLRSADLGVLDYLSAPPTVDDVLACSRRLEAVVESARVLVLSPREILTRPLERHGLEIRRESHPLRLMELCTSFEPHVVVLDALMAGPGPLTLCRALTAAGATREIPVVVANLPADPELRAEALRCGALDVLCPELHEVELVERVSGLALRRMREQRPYDANSGLLDGALFRELLDRRLSEARRRAETVSAALIGLDGRHALRARLGAAGVAGVEANVARRLSSGFRRHDLVGIGPNGTFAVVFLEERPSSARLALLRVLSLVRSMRLPSADGRFNVSCSAGVVAFPVAGTTADELMDAAERLLDRAQAEGGDRVVAG